MSSNLAGIDAGIVAAGFSATPDLPVQVAMIPTLHARTIRSRRIELPPAAFVVVDEAHHATARSWRLIIEAYPAARVVGMTATPCRKNGSGLGVLFQDIVETPQITELIEQGWLVPPKVYSAPGLDLTGLRSQGGDYIEKELAACVDTGKLVGDIVSHWWRHAAGLKTIAFAVNVGHSRHLAEEFNRSGAVAEHLDGTTQAEEREAILKRLANGTTDIVCNCAVLTEGFDLPTIRAIVLARPTHSFALYRQMGGRGLRRASGKNDCVILDHAGCLMRHGWLQDPVLWTLDPRERVVNRAHEARMSSYHRKLVECPECGASRFQGKGCPSCGWRPRTKGQLVKVIDEDLVLRERGREAKPHEWTNEERREFYAELLGLCDELNRGRRRRGKPDFKPGWVDIQYREKFKGHWPSGEWAGDPARAPSSATRGWVRSRFIAWARGH